MRRKRLHRSACSKRASRQRQGARQFRAPQFIHLGEQHMHRAAGVLGPFNQTFIALEHAAARIDHQEQATQRFPGRQGSSHRRPGGAFGGACLGIAIAWQVNNAATRRQQKEIQQPGAARRLAGARQRALARDRVDSARFTGIGAARKGHLGPVIQGELARVCGTQNQGGGGIGAQGGWRCRLKGEWEYR